MRAEREPSGGEGGGGGFHDLIRRGNPGRPSVVLDYFCFYGGLLGISGAIANHHRKTSDRGVLHASRWQLSALLIYHTVTSCIPPSATGYFSLPQLIKRRRGYHSMSVYHSMPPSRNLFIPKSHRRKAIASIPPSTPPVHKLPRAGRAESEYLLVGKNEKFVF